MPKATISGWHLQFLFYYPMSMKKTTVRTITNMEIPETPIKAKNLSFYILLASVNGNYKKATAKTMKT